MSLISLNNSFKNIVPGFYGEGIPFMYNGVINNTLLFNTNVGGGSTAATISFNYIGSNVFLFLEFPPVTGANAPWNSLNSVSPGQTDMSVTNIPMTNIPTQQAIFGSNGVQQLTGVLGFTGNVGVNREISIAFDTAIDNANGDFNMNNVVYIYYANTYVFPPALGLGHKLELEPIIKKEELKKEIVINNRLSRFNTVKRESKTMENKVESKTMENKVEPKIEEKKIEIVPTKIDNSISNYNQAIQNIQAKMNIRIPNRTGF